MDKVFLDLETTGLDALKGDKIIEICCLKLKKNYIEEIFHKYLNPKIEITEEAYNVHGIKNSMLKNEPFFEDIVLKFLDFIKNSKIVIHNSIFDIGFLNKELSLLGFPKFSFFYYKVVDTLKLSRKIYPNKRNSLEMLCKRFRIDYTVRKKHSAIVDVSLLRKVYYRLCMIFNKIKIKKYKKYENKFILLKKSLIVKKSLNKDKLLDRFFKKLIF